VIGGGIAAYKSLDLIRRLRERDFEVRCVMTEAAKRFVTPLAVAALAGDKVYEDLFSLTDEAEMGHIRLSREADLVVVAPATANLMARMAQGHADDLASTVLLATDKPVLVAPAMNPQMWNHPATKRNVAQLLGDGLSLVGPNPGDMACGEVGSGRMAEPLEIVAAVVQKLADTGKPLLGRRALVTSGPTYEAVDPVRFIGNRSSGRQGHAIARALSLAGASVTLVSGPVALPDPAEVTAVHVESAREMLLACEAALPVDIAVCAAAVADWRPAEPHQEKLKKGEGPPPSLQLLPNPDILQAISRRTLERPALVVGFAAETSDLERRAELKLERKGCDWIVGNDVGADATIFGGEQNTVLLLRRDAPAERWPRMSKSEIAERLTARIGERLAATPMRS
jgi:phosphopantothenoylcysteine decarboxylase / phosphopantothenate---cysteine ligase